jgi:GntR family transcriptional repressor for pyruvate dehydrogenase complex
LAITKVRLSDQVVDEIKRIIHDGQYAPGDKLQSENELTRMLGVSRSSIREAVRLLEVSGIVTVRHGKGIFVSHPRQKSSQAFAEWLLHNESSVEEHFEIRLIIDTKAAAYAADRASPEDIQKLEEICEAYRVQAETRTPAEMIKLDERFHLQLAKSTKNKTLFMIMKTMTQALPEGWISSLHIPGRIQKTIQEHIEIVSAIRSRNRKLSEQKMESHLKNALADIRSSMVDAKGAKE